MDLLITVQDMFSLLLNTAVNIGVDS